MVDVLVEGRVPDGLEARGKQRVLSRLGVVDEQVEVLEEA